MPPPPPPPAPPPLPFLSGSQGSKTDFRPPADRNALLSQIRKGARLKNVDSNDRSAPIVDGSGKNSSSNRGNTNMCKTNGPSPLIPPGGLFAQGMPKLRSTISKGGNGNGRPPLFSHSSMQNEGLYPHDRSTGVLSPSEMGGGSRSQPPSPAVKNRQMQVHRSLTESTSCRNYSSDAGNVKGPAPAPPPANQKPNFLNDCGVKKIQVGVRRSSSQTSLGPKVRPARPPPNIRPPPPPKSSAVLNSAPPPPPSKPPNVMRRQSFGMGDATFIMNYDGSRFSSKLSVPPPPPRNNSAPNSLNQVPNSSPTSIHLNKMTTAPPPPPSRPAVGNIRAPIMRPPPPPIRAPAPPPPPPPHRFMAHPMPPSLHKVNHITNSSAPPPPTRISSVTSNTNSSDFAPDFESRFVHKFQNVRNLPAPDKFTNMYKVYGSRMVREKSVRRQPPPPPPTVNGIAHPSRGSHPPHQPVLHIQLESRIFANNTAHC